jgi:hypothetical protein
MILMNDMLVDLVKRGLVMPDEAYLKAIDRSSLLVQFKTANIPPPSLAESSS